jgi:hypothetical protein
MHDTTMRIASPHHALRYCVRISTFLYSRSAHMVVAVADRRRDLEDTWWRNPDENS